MLHPHWYLLLHTILITPPSIYFQVICNVWQTSTYIPAALHSQETWGNCWWFISNIFFWICSFLSSWQKQNLSLGALKLPLNLPLNQICMLPSLDFSYLFPSLSVSFPLFLYYFLCFCFSIRTAFSESTPTGIRLTDDRPFLLVSSTSWTGNNYIVHEPLLSFVVCLSVLYTCSSCACITVVMPWH